MICGIDEPKMKPDVVQDYMRLVDKSDMQIGKVECVRKTLKCYKKVFLHLIDICVLNTYDLYKVQTGKNISLRLFSHTVVAELLATYGTPIEAVTPPP